jgi:hypothetical protein
VNRSRILFVPETITWDAKNANPISHSQFSFHLLLILIKQDKQIWKLKSSLNNVSKHSLALSAKASFVSCVSELVSALFGRLLNQFPDGLLCVKIREVCLELFSVFPVLKGRNTCIGWKHVPPIVSIHIASHIYAFNIRNPANTNGLVAYLACK